MDFTENQLGNTVFKGDRFTEKTVLVLKLYNGID